MIFFIVILAIGLFIFRIFISSPGVIGKVGEKRVAVKLDWLPKEYITLNDIMLKTEYGTTQIDHIVVSPYGIFVIETKNYKGWILGYENSEEWTQSLYGKKSWYGWTSEQHKFRNPIRQNLAHTRAIKQLLSDIGDFRIIPIVAFSDKAELKIRTPNNIVINWYNLRYTITHYNVPCIPEHQIKTIVSRIQSSNIINEETRKTHNYTVNRKIQVIEQMVANGICPQCKSKLVERRGKYGKFLGCSNYPKCRYTHQIYN